jgi:hypothetical protein
VWLFKNRCFGETQRLHHEGDKNRRTTNTLAITSNRWKLRRNTMWTDKNRWTGNTLAVTSDRCMLRRNTKWAHFVFLHRVHRLLVTANVFLVHRFLSPWWWRR